MKLNNWKYKQVYTNTLEGLKKAERLQAQGWSFRINGLYGLLFWKEI